MGIDTLQGQRQGCDVKNLIDRVGVSVSDYTKQRIRTSFEFMPQILAKCVDLEYGFAVDVGCGGGFDSFALATVFDRVAAFDADPDAVKQARTVLEHATCDHLSFTVDKAETFAVHGDADLIYCNLMSHNVDSRLDLLERFNAVLKPHGWLVYSEISEAYAAREIGLALQHRDIKALSERLCQLWAGFTGSGGFRFFDSASLEQTLDRSGFKVAHEVTTAWAGIPESRQVWARRVRSKQESFSDTDDYASRSSDFVEAGAICAAYCNAPTGRARSSGDLVSALPREHRFFPFLFLLQMFDELGHGLCLDQDTGMLSRFVGRIRHWHLARTIRWETLDGLYTAFKSEVADRDNR